MKEKFYRPLIIVFSIVLLTACGHLSRTEKQTELTDRWNANDSQLVADEMIGDMLSFPWIREYHLQQHGSSRPTVIIQRVRNKSHEHIPVETFINDLKRALIRSGQVDFVVGEAERMDIRRERAVQEGNAADPVEFGQETASDFALSGVINSHVDELGRTRTVAFQVDLKLINMKTNREVWNGQKKINKERRRALIHF